MSARASTLTRTPGARADRWFLAVAAIALVAYARSFTAAFQFDDNHQILNPRVLQESSWHDFFLWGRTRLIPFGTLAINYWLSGARPFWFHVVNFMVHLAACFTVYRLALALCDTPVLRTTWWAPRAHLLGLAAALLFAVHPIQVQAVTYIVQRMSSMAALFYLAAVLWYVRCRIAETAGDLARCRRAYASALGLATAASLSKENTASLPLAILLVEWVFFAGHHARTRFLRRWAPFLVFALAMPILFWALDRRPAPRPANVAASRQAAVAGRAAAPPVMRETPVPSAPVIAQGEEFAATLRRAASAGAISPGDYFLTQCRVLPRYLGLVIFPAGFTIDHDVPLETSFSGGVLAGLTFLLLLLGFGFYSARRWPLLGFGILWFFIAHSVESTMIPIGDLMNDHRMYLAMPGVALVAAMAFLYSWERTPRLAGLVGVAVAGALVLLTMWRNEIWQTPMSLWQDAVAKSPGKPRVHLNVGTSYFLQGDYASAIDHYCEVLRLDPKHRAAESYIQAAMTHLVEAEDAVVEFELAATGSDGTLQLVPRHPCPGGKKRVPVEE